jgi:hypothetical protein
MLRGEILFFVFSFEGMKRSQSSNLTYRNSGGESARSRVVSTVPYENTFIDIQDSVDTTRTWRRNFAEVKSIVKNVVGT